MERKYINRYNTFCKCFEHAINLHMIMTEVLHSKNFKILSMFTIHCLKRCEIM